MVGGAVRVRVVVAAIRVGVVVGVAVRARGVVTGTVMIPLEPLRMRKDALVREQVALAGGALGRRPYLGVCAGGLVGIVTPIVTVSTTVAGFGWHGCGEGLIGLCRRV